MNKQLIIALFLLVGLGSTQAQEKGHYIYINGGAGLHNFQYDLLGGTEKGDLAYTFNVGYNYFFSDNWGIATGLGIQSFTSESTIDYMTETPSTDSDGDSFLYRAYYDGWKEEQKMLLLDIPVGISYQTKLSVKWKLQATLGAKISLPISTGYEITDGEIETRGYYPQYNVELYGLPQHNLTTISSFPSADISINPTFSSFVDVGGLYKLSQSLDLYVGAYMNYALNSSIDMQEKLLYQEDGTYNGVLGSNQASNAYPIAYGLKLGLTWHASPKIKTTKKVKPSMVAQPMTVKEKPVVEVIKELPKPVVVKETKPVVVATVLPKEPTPIVKAKKITAVTDIKFALGSEKVVGDKQDDKIKSLAEILKENPAMKLRIIGHTCDIASREVNIKVGMLRANMVKEGLLKQGVAAAQLITESKAFDEPLVPNTNEENRAKNRRVQLVVE